MEKVDRCVAEVYTMCLGDTMANISTIQVHGWQKKTKENKKQTNKMMRVKSGKRMELSNMMVNMGGIHYPPIDRTKWDKIKVYGACEMGGCVKPHLNAEVSPLSRKAGKKKSR